MARDSHPLLHYTLISDIVELCDLMEHASRGKAEHKWITTTLAEASLHKASRTDSYISDHSVQRSHLPAPFGQRLRPTTTKQNSTYG